MSHATLIDRLNGAATAEDLATVLASVIRLDRPGFPNDLADGDYFDGFFFATVESGRLAVTQVHHLAPHVLILWGELDATERAEKTAAYEQNRAETDARRDRGRPEIGRPVQVRLPAWMLDLVDTYADTYEVSRADAIRALIVAGHRSGTARHITR